MEEAPTKLAVLISGSGRTLQNFVDLIAAGKLPASIELVIASRAGIGGVAKAAAAGLKCVVVEAGPEQSREVFRLCDEAQVDLVCLAGWLRLLTLPPTYAGRVMNIHPALLPGHGGKGMYGRHVHQAVLDDGCKISGCTVHFVDPTYDTGPIILQRVCPVLETDTAESLGARVFAEELIAYPEAIRRFHDGRVPPSPLPSPGVPGEGESA